MEMKMEMISVAILAARRALATSEFHRDAALTERLRQTGMTVSEAVRCDSWRVFRIGNLLC
ncbi:MAG: hypothetical protein AB1642_00005 [Pseudomonadota bacterium]